MKSSDHNKNEREEFNNFQYRVHYKVNGVKYFVLIQDP